MAPTTVSFQGAPGAFTHEVITGLWGEGTDILPCDTFHAAVQALVTGTATHLVIPVSNSSIGPIHPALDALGNAPGLREIDRVTYNVRHMLMSVPGATVDGIRRIMSHPAALQQCSRFLASLPEASIEEAFDTAGSAAFVAMTGDATIAAVAPLGAGRLYGLAVLATDIQDTKDNATSFAVLTRDAP